MSAEQRNTPVLSDDSALGFSDLRGGMTLFCDIHGETLNKAGMRQRPTMSLRKIKPQGPYYWAPIRIEDPEDLEDFQYSGSSFYTQNIALLTHGPIGNVHVEVSITTSEVIQKLSGGFIEISTPESPFLKIDDSRDDDLKIDELILFCKEALNASFGKQLSERIRYIVEYETSDPEGILISYLSLRNLVAFIQQEPRLKFPDIVLSGSGNFVAEWRKSSSRHFSAEFLPSGDVSFVVFKPNPLEPERPIRLCEICPWQNLIEEITPHHVLSWAIDDNE